MFLPTTTETTGFRNGSCAGGASIARVEGRAAFTPRTMSVVAAASPRPRDCDNALDVRAAVTRAPRTVAVWINLRDGFNVVGPKCRHGELAGAAKSRPTRRHAFVEEANHDAWGTNDSGSPRCRRSAIRAAKNPFRHCTCSRHLSRSSCSSP